MLVKLEDENGSYTIIPEMHLPFLSDVPARMMGEGIVKYGIKL